LLDELNSTLRDAGRSGSSFRNRAGRRQPDDFRPPYSAVYCHSNRRYPEIDFVLHDRPQQWVLESIRQGKWILVLLSIPARRRSAV
jgi:hypothetical protein